jgi:3,4-dihydroxy 2-butanone 4-phosphate synthase
MTIAKIEDGIAAIAHGEMIIVVDDPSRENEGDIVVATEAVTAQSIAFMMRYARGLVCIAMEGEDLDRLAIPLMVPRNTESQQTAFTVSVDYIHGTTTGISAADRATTVRALIDGETAPADFARPGHIFPLRAHAQGVLVRQGHTEAAVELARLAGLRPSGVICEVANDDGSMARVPDLEKFAAEHRLLIVCIADLVTYLKRSQAAA